MKLRCLERQEMGEPIQLLGRSSQPGARGAALPAAVAGPAIFLVYVIAHRASGLVVKDIPVALTDGMPGWNLCHR